jgi:hypothetical protein
MKTRLWLALHALVAVVPVLGMLVRAPDTILYGFEVPPAAPVWSATGWREEQVQKGFQSWFEANLGFRGAMIRTDNAVQAFGVGEAKPSGAVVIGEDGTYFLKDDLWYMNRPTEDLPVVFTRIAALSVRLGTVQRKLAARGKKMLVLIAPSKTAIYPEAIPRRWRHGLRSDLAVHAELRDALVRNGVVFADGHDLLQSSTFAPREHLFARTGRHWTRLGACVVLREAFEGSASRPTCKYEMVPSKRLAETDYDLYELLNVWRPFETPGMVPLLEQRGPSAALSPSEPKPRALFVGTSFLWMLADALRPHLQAPIAFYYNKTAYDVSEGQRELGPVDPDSASWSLHALERVLYVVEVLETDVTGDELVGFLDTLERRLD